MSSAIRVLRRKRRQSNLRTGAAVINVNATISFPPALAVTTMSWVVTLNASDAVSSLPFTIPELARIKCVQHNTADGWFTTDCSAVIDLGDDPSGRGYELQFENGFFVDPTTADTITILLVPPDSQLFTTASGAPARGFINACPIVVGGEAYISSVYADSM